MKPHRCSYRLLRYQLGSGSIQLVSRTEKGSSMTQWRKSFYS